MGHVVSEQNHSQSATYPYRPYKFHGKNYWIARELADPLVRHWQDAVKDLRRGFLLGWFRDELRDQDVIRLAMDLDELEISYDERLLRLVVGLMPEIHPVWRGYALTPESLIVLAQDALQEEGTVARDWLVEIYVGDLLALFSPEHYSNIHTLRTHWQASVHLYEQGWKKVIRHGLPQEVRPEQAAMLPVLLLVSESPLFVENLKERLVNLDLAILPRCSGCTLLGSPETLPPPQQLVFLSLIENTRETIEKSQNQLRKEIQSLTKEFQPLWGHFADLDEDLDYLQSALDKDPQTLIVALDMIPRVRDQANEVLALALGIETLKTEGAFLLQRCVVFDEDVQKCEAALASGQYSQVKKFLKVLSHARLRSQQLLAAIGVYQKLRDLLIPDSLARPLLREIAVQIMPLDYGSAGKLYEALDTNKIWQTDSFDFVGIKTPFRQWGGHSKNINTLAFSPEGQYLASGSSDCTIRLWMPEQPSKTSRRTLLGHLNPVLGLSFDPTGEWLASVGGERLIKIWHVEGKFSPRTLRCTKKALCVAISPTGKYLAYGGLNGTLAIMEFPGGRMVKSIKGHNTAIESIHFSPDGQYLASGGLDNQVILWQVHPLKQIRQLQGHKDGVLSVACSPDNRFVASAGLDKVIRLWDRQSGRCLYSFRGHQGWIGTLAFTPDSRCLISGSDDCTVKIWRIFPEAHYMATLSSHSDRVRAVAISPDGGVLASASRQQGIFLWQAKRTVTDSVVLPLRRFIPWERARHERIEHWTQRASQPPL